MTDESYFDRFFKESLANIEQELRNKLTGVEEKFKNITEVIIFFLEFPNT